MKGIYVIHTAFASPRDRGVADFSIDPVAEFTAEARRIGLVLDHAVDDDRIHRVPVEGKGPRNTSGSYKLSVADDGFAFGWAKNWPTGEIVSYCNKSPSPERAPEWAERRQAAQAKAEREREQEKAEKLAESMREFHEAGRCTSHPYFAEKGVPVPADCRVNERGSALVPVYRNGKPVGFERIFAKPLPDGRRKGHCSGGLGEGFHWTDGDESAVYITEGIAKSMAVHEATGAKVYTAFGKDRLMACAKLVREVYPDAHIIVAGDMDNDPTRGPKDAQEAATAVGGVCVLPPNPDEDWDDILRKRGAEALVDALRVEAARQVHELVLDEKGRPIWNAANALTVLSSHHDWVGVFGFNELSGRRVVLKSLPDSDRITVPRDLVDDDYTAVRAWFNRNGYPRATGEITCEAVRAVARLNSFDPLTDYLDGLRWDGKNRIDTWLIDYLGADDSPQRRAYGRKWLISAVARAYSPGCKADYMLVLEGEQGLRKSSVVRALTGDDWFSDNLPPMGTKDASEHLAGRWVIEVAELDSMSKAGIEAAKAFITRQVESFRPAYGREVINQPRRCVFIGTTNRDNWLNDSSGGRRFWPVRVGCIDIDAVTRDRDQIWAEAVAAYRSSEPWWLDDEMEALARQDQADRRNGDPWEAEIARFIRGTAQASIGDLLRDCLGIPKDRQDRKMSNRVSAVLQALGWRRDGKFTSGALKGQIKYVPVH